MQSDVVGVIGGLLSSFENFLRRSSKDVEHFVSLVGPAVKKAHANIINAVSVTILLALTPRFLATRHLPVQL